ncbi:MAG TPA: galactokinase [Kineosporiaceae bacterium]|nr:galactokinase [Kineosporiaceae bacterium]
MRVGTVTWYPDADEGTRTATARRTAEDFEAAFGRPPAGVWAAPGRVNLIGEHVDYNGGLCLPFALAHRTYVALAPRQDDLVVVGTTQLADGDPRLGRSHWEGGLAEIAPGTVDGWAGYAVGVPWALCQAGHPVPGFEAVVRGLVPVGAGLSSSAALECAVAVALDDVAHLGLSGHDAGRKELAAACVRAENDIAGAPTGGMDQTVSLRARAGAALLIDCLDFSVRHVPLDLPGTGLELLVIDTRAHHALQDGQYGSRREACERAAALLGVDRLRDVHLIELEGALRRLRELVDPEEADEMCRRVRHVVTEISRVRQTVLLVEDGDVAGIGPLLEASHASLREDYEVSSVELDLAVEAARAAGALGARMTGAGFGGSAIALIRAGEGGAVAAEVARAFAARGFGPPAFLHAAPSAPAGRLA